MGWLRCFGVWSCVLLARCAALDQLWCEDLPVTVMPSFELSSSIQGERKRRSPPMDRKLVEKQEAKGLNGCVSSFTLEVLRGDSRSLNLSLNETWQKLVKKWDPETKTWEEEILNGLGKDNSLMGKTSSISLVNGHFTVRNAEKREEGLYKIERYLDNSCLAVVNVLVQDLPLPVTVMPSFDLSSTITSKVTETPKASPPGRDDTAVYVAPFVSAGIIIAVFFLVRKWIKSKCRPDGAASDVDPEKCMNGSQSPQQEESTTT